MAVEKRVDLSHHLSRVAKARKASPLKDLQRVFDGNPSIIQLATGSPDENYFPFSSISSEVSLPDAQPLPATPRLSWIWRLFNGGKEKLDTISMLKWTDDPADMNLATMLQYGTAVGSSHLVKFLTEFTKKFYEPASDDVKVLLSTGNTDAWVKVSSLLLNPGDPFLVCEWTYTTMLAASIPCDFMPVTLGMDREGMSSDSLRETLEGWDESARGAARPHMLYVVPVGQNPTGATMSAARKKEIYDICVEFDVIIVEDDPYYFLQEGPYVSKTQRQDRPQRGEEYIHALVPSFLKFDTQGRVIRLDTFSKTLAPGLRLGWFTCNPLFAERLERTAEVSTQSPCGFGQAMTAMLLKHWGQHGYIRWLQGMCLRYKERRDFLLDALADEFDLEFSTERCNAFLQPEEKLQHTEPLFSFVPPTSGMFVWFQIHFPDYPDMSTKDLELKFWKTLAENGVLFGPGSIFAASDDWDRPSAHGHFRVSFSHASKEDLTKAVRIFGMVVRKFRRDFWPEDVEPVHAAPSYQRRYHRLTRSPVSVRTPYFDDCRALAFSPDSDCQKFFP